MPSYDKRNDAFRALARYIGVFGTAENTKAEPMAMTAPVITEKTEAKNEGQKMAMTAPVTTKKKSGSEDETMSFVLPFEFDDIEQVPRPTNEMIRISEIPAENMATIQFSGWYTESEGQAQLKKLTDALKEDNIDVGAEPDWSVAQYNPPFTLPFLRRNEIWVKLPNYTPSATDSKDTKTSE